MGRKVEKMKPMPTVEKLRRREETVTRGRGRALRWEWMELPMEERMKKVKR